LDRWTPGLKLAWENVFLAAADGPQARRTTCYPDRIQPWLNPPTMTYRLASSEETGAPNLSNGRKGVPSRGRGGQRSVSKRFGRFHVAWFPRVGRRLGAFSRGWARLVSSPVL
jgi:hypothetical protein